MNGSFHIDIPIIGPRTAIVPIGKAGDPQAIDIITEHPVALSTPHPANDGGDVGRKELDHHLPCTVHDDGAGSVRTIVEGFSIKVGFNPIGKSAPQTAPSPSRLSRTTQERDRRALAIQRDAVALQDYGAGLDASLTQEPTKVYGFVKILGGVESD
jgi:hypothetical protein